MDGQQKRCCSSMGCFVFGVKFYRELSLIGQAKGSQWYLLRKTGCEKVSVSIPATGRVDKRVLAVLAEENRVRKNKRIRFSYRSGRQKRVLAVLAEENRVRKNKRIRFSYRSGRQKRVLAVLAEENRVRKDKLIRFGYRSGR